MFQLEREMRKQSECAINRIHELQHDLMDSNGKLRQQVVDLEDTRAINEKLEYKLDAFSLDRFKEDDKAIHFYTGFPSYKRLVMVFDYLNPGDRGQNIMY